MSYNSKEEFTFQIIFRTLLLNKKFLGIFVTCGILFIMLFSYIMPYEYKSVATLLPPKDNSSGGGLSSFLQSVSGGGIVLGNLGQSNQSQVFAEILKSRIVASKIIEENGIDKMKEYKDLTPTQLQDIVRSYLEVEIERSGLIYISSSYKTGYFSGAKEKDKAKVLSSAIANSAISGLDKVIRTKNISTARLTRIYIEDELNKYKAQLDSIEGKMESFQSDNKVLSIDDQTQAVVEQAILIGTELAKAETELNIYSQIYKPNSEQVKQQQKQVDFLRSQTRRVQEGGLNSDDFALSLRSVPKLARSYANLYRDQKILEQVILYLETQRHQEAIQEKRDLPIVEPLDKAAPPDVRSSPNRKLMLILSFIIFGLIGSVYIIAKAYIKGNIQSEEYMKDKADVNVSAN